MILAAVLDTSVLFPQLLRDTLLRVASQGLYRPLWTAEILRELSQQIPAAYPDRPPDIDRTIGFMRVAFPDAEVVGYDDLVPTIEIPDAKDRHVVAAALRGGADLIVTRNLADFPASVLRSVGLEAQSPDAFLLERFDERPDRVLEALREQAGAYRRPPMTVDELVAGLEARHGLTDFVAAVRRGLRRD
ncbi:MAG TPA: PIN domain-containing protein [Actinomycetota bacterium]|nr:PIN domain-containing protein [Actinomycetota bacterium]